MAIYNIESILENYGFGPINLQNQYNNINIDIQKINELIESVSLDSEEAQEYLSEAKAKYINTLDFIGDIVDDNKYILKSIKDCAKEIVATIKDKGINQSLFDTLTITVSKYFGMIADRLTVDKIINNEKIKGEVVDKDKLKSAAHIFLQFYIMTSICQTVISLLFITNITMSYNITAIIIGPILEEFAKKLSVKSGCTKEFYLIFNAFEFTQYVSTYAIIVGLKKIVITRIKALGMHLVTTIVQFLSDNKKVQHILKLDKEEDKEKLSTLGYLCGVLIHSTWNGLAVAGKIK